MSRAALWIFGAVLLPALCAGGLWLFIYEMDKQDPQHVVVGTAGVGQPFNWRVLEHHTILLPFQGGTYGGLAAGNFDTDPDRELLLVGPRYSSFFDADGKRHSVALHGLAFMMDIAAWDYDGDGIDEVLPEPIEFNVVTQYKPGSGSSAPPLPSASPVFKLDGTRLADLPSVAGATNRPFYYDFDRDRHLDIGMTGLDSDMRVQFFGVQGKPCGTLSATATPGSRRTNFGALAVADITGDGSPEVITAENRAKDICATDVHGKHWLLCRVNFVTLNVTPADVDGDGRTDLIFGAEGYYNPGQEAFIPLAYQNSTMPETCKVAVADVLGNGSNQIAVLQGKTIPFANELDLFDPRGTLVHSENFSTGNPQSRKSMIGLVQTMVNIRAKGRDYLCLQFADKLLIYP